MDKVIEIACTANFGRSEPGRLMAERHLRKRPWYTVISSGTHVDEVKEGVGYEWKKKAVQLAIDRGIYSVHDTVLANRALRNDDQTVVEGFYDIAEHIFHHEEAAARAKELAGAGYNPLEVKDVQEQTVARDDTVAVFTMSQRNKDVVESLYKDHPNSPIITSLDISSPYGKGAEKYHGAFRELQIKIPHTLNELIYE